MALGDPYVNVSEYRSAIERADPADENTTKRNLIAISRYIDRKLGRPLGFQKDAADVERIYLVPPGRNSRRRDDWAESENPWLYGGGTRMLPIDDHVSITTLEYDNAGTWVEIDSDDYELLPRNAPTLPEPEPYNAIELTGRGTFTMFSPGMKIRITGKGGWPSVPEAIVVSTVQLAGMVLGLTPYSTNVIQVLDGDSQVSAQARAVLSGLHRYYLNARVLV